MFTESAQMGSTQVLPESSELESSNLALSCLCQNFNDSLKIDLEIRSFSDFHFSVLKDNNIVSNDL